MVDILGTSTIGFNPRTRKGCDFQSDAEAGTLFVSIHAPVKDATILLSVYQLRNICFNPRTRKGCDSMFMESFIDNIFSI